MTASLTFKWIQDEEPIPFGQIQVTVNSGTLNDESDDLALLGQKLNNLLRSSFSFLWWCFCLILAKKAKQNIEVEAETRAGSEREGERAGGEVLQGSCSDLLWQLVFSTWFKIWRGGENDDVLRHFKCLKHRLASEFATFCAEQLHQLNFHAMRTNAFFLQPCHPIVLSPQDQRYLGISEWRNNNWICWSFYISTPIT